MAKIYKFVTQWIDIIYKKFMKEFTGKYLGGFENGRCPRCSFGRPYISVSRIDHSIDKKITKFVEYACPKCHYFESKEVQMDFTSDDVEKARQILIKTGKIKPNKEYLDLLKSKERKCPGCGKNDSLMWIKGEEGLHCVADGSVYVKYPFPFKEYDNVKKIISEYKTKKAKL